MPAPASSITTATVREYLSRRGVLTDPQSWHATELTGGVSGSVILLRRGARRLVVKQALSQLRVAAPWSAKPERTLTEAAAIELLHRFTPRHTPELIDVDETDLVVTMSAAPASWQPWKTLLLAGGPHPTPVAEVAATLGRVLGMWHRSTWHDRAVAQRFADDEAFEQLRVGPFHHAIRARHPRLADPIDACVIDLTTKHECLVHGDYSPKNVLVGTDGLWVLDFEVAHVGAAVFDVAFLECHLILKAMHRPRDAPLLRAGAAAFVAAYTDSLDRPPSLDRLGWHTACLLLARVDGTSPAGYLSADTDQRVRHLATELLSDADPPMAEVWDRAIAHGGGPP